MAEPSTKKEVRLHSTNDDIFRLRMIGYNDFRYMDGWEFYRVYSWDSLHYVRNGKGKLFIHGDEYDINAGDIFFIPKNEAIMYYPDPNDPWRYYWINFNADSRFDIGAKLGLDAENPVRSARHQNKITDTFDELFKNDLPVAELYYETLSVAMKIIASEACHDKSPLLLSNPHEELVESAKKLIKLNYTRADFSVSDIPEMLFVSQRHLSSLFRERVGMTPVAYLSEIRLLAAADLLQKKDLTVSELCRTIGWGDELYFMKRFKKRFKLTVKEYREEVKRLP